jgi:hypothetical protein
MHLLASAVWGSGKSQPLMIHRLGSSGKESGFFWEREWVLLGKTHFGKLLKTKAYLAFSAPYIPFKYIF